MADPVATPEVRRNAPCPCGSGKRYKHCHGALQHQKSDESELITTLIDQNPSAITPAAPALNRGLAERSETSPSRVEPGTARKRADESGSMGRSINKENVQAEGFSLSQKIIMRTALIAIIG